MNNYYKLAALAFMYAAAFSAHSQSQSQSQLQKNSFVESVWLWQIETPTRLVYIAGEMHDHAITADENLSHLLANTAYDLSSHILIEAVDTDRLGNSLLKNRLSAPTWAALETAIRYSVTKKLAVNKDLTAAQRNTPIENIIDVINRMPDERLFRVLPTMLLPLPDENSDVFRNEIGFLKKISSSDNKGNLTKQSVIEKADEAWSESCNKPSDIELLISEILIATGPNAQKSEGNIQDVINEFRNPRATTASLTQRIENSLFWDILNKCTVRPRNLKWITKIKNELGKDNQPLMIVAGAGHVVGDTGLLSLLCKEGYCNSKRIHLVDLLKK
jgi:TraB/PrgY/gumN family